MKHVSWFVLAAAVGAPLSVAHGDDETAFEVHGLVQGWYLPDSDVLVRHAFLSAGAERGPLRVDATFDLAPVLSVGPSRASDGEPDEPIEVINDLVVRYTRGAATVTVGQEGQPIGIDGPRAHGAQWFADRSELGYALGQTADIGAWVDVEQGAVAWRAGVLGGEGPNTAPGTDPRAVGRVAIGERFVVGATGVVGVTGRGDWLGGVDAALDDGALRFDVEAYAGALPDEEGAVTTTAAGAVAEAAYTLGPWMPAARVEWFDGDVALDGGAVVRGTACVNYAFDADAFDRLQLQVSAAQHDGVRMETAPAAEHRVLLSGQVGF